MIAGSSRDVAGLALLIGRLERLNDSVVSGVCADHAISPGELRVLAMLRHGSPPEGIRPAVISQWIVQTSGGLTATIDRLEKAGRLVRRPDPADGRARLIALTDAGIDFYDQVFDQLTTRYAGILGHLDLPEMTVAVRSLIDAYERAEGQLLSSGWDLPAPISEEIE